MDAQISTCSFHDFQGHLPFVPSQTSISSCLESLATNRDNGSAMLVKVDNGRYQLRNSSAKRKSGINETEHFKVVGETSRRLKQCTIHARTLAYQYFDYFSTQIDSDIEGSATNIDGAMIPAWLAAQNIKNSGHHTTNIAVACKWKVEPSKANKRKVSGLIPCHGLTITDCRVRITTKSWIQTCKSWMMMPVACSATG